MTKWNETANLSLFSFSFFIFFSYHKSLMPKQDRFFRPLVEFFSYKNEKKMIRKIFLVWVYYIRSLILLGIIRSAAVEHEKLRVLSLETN